jgi:hypothetical protein
MYEQISAAGQSKSTSLLKIISVLRSIKISCTISVFLLQEIFFVVEHEARLQDVCGY